VPDRPPLSAGALPALLSRVLVAFTIEFDNQAEQRMVHRTTLGRGDGPQRGPWLVSLPMWANFVRFVSEDGGPLRDLQGLAAITNLAGLQRWGYVTVDDGPDALVRLSRGGRHARKVWTPLAAEIEGRWRDRFGTGPADELRERLGGLARQLRPDLPWYLPVVHHGMFAQAQPLSDRVRAADHGHADLSVLLSRVLLAFTLDYEDQAEWEQEIRLSLTISASLLRVLDETGVRLRDLPGRAGVSREGTSMALGELSRAGLAATGPDPAGGRGQVARLTRRGLRARQDSQRRLADVEASWADRFGPAEIDGLAGALHDLLTRPGQDGTPLMAAGLHPPPGGWRSQRPYLSQTEAVLRDPAGALPRHPMVLHRGGFPDGS
jgi:DNA-binding MarR family transcriptional regulator